LFAYLYFTTTQTALVPSREVRERRKEKERECEKGAEITY